MAIKSFLLAAALIVSFCRWCVAQDAKPAAPEEQRIAFLREKMAAYRLRSASADDVTYPLQDKLALRWSNPVSGVVDGGIFVWTDNGRPMVIGKCFLNEAKEA